MGDGRWTVAAYDDTLHGEGVVAEERDGVVEGEFYMGTG